MIYPAWFDGERIETPPKPTATPTERIKTIYRDNQSAAQMWRIAHHQLEVQFDRATFETYLREVVLVDYDASSLTFTLAAERPHQVEMLQYRLMRNVRRMLSDACGDEVTVQFVTFDDWEHRTQ